MAEVRVRWNSAELATMLDRQSLIIMRRKGEQVRTAAVRRCPVDTGDLRASIAVEVLAGANPVVRVGSRLAYALYVHEGHGIIRPKTAKILRWPNVNNKYVQTGGNRRFSGGKTASYVYARRVRAVKGRPFLRDAAVEVLGADSVRG